MYRWKQAYSYIIPTILTILYIVYLVAVYRHEKKLPLIQDSSSFEGMLEALVTFMSIILSVFGFLIPSFLSGKGESKCNNIFFKVCRYENLLSKVEKCGSHWINRYVFNMYFVSKRYFFGDDSEYYNWCLAMVLIFLHVQFI